jgi:hypothetical protein
MSDNSRAHNSDNYRATTKMQIWLRPKESSAAADWLTLGNIVSFSHNVENQSLEHFSNYLGQRAKDREIITERKLSLEFVIDELNMANLKLIHGFGFGAATSSTKDKKFDRTVKNPGGGVSISLGKTGIKNVIVRSVSLGTDVTYVEDTLETDSTENTAGGDWNNVTSPLTITDAVVDYPGITFEVGLFLKIQNEILKVTAVDGNDVTFARAQLGTMAAVHADGEDIFVSGSGDYVEDLTNGVVVPVLDGDLENPGTVASIHIFFEQQVNVSKFEMYPGDTIECEAQVQFDDEIEGPFQGCFLKNNGPIDLGDGSDTRKVSLTLEIAVDADGTFGDYAKETA